MPDSINPADYDSVCHYFVFICESDYIDPADHCIALAVNLSVVFVSKCQYIAQFNHDRGSKNLLIQLSVPV